MKRVTRAILLILLAGLVLFTAAAVDAYSAVGRIPTTGAKYPTARIRQLVWPTIGYPALTTPGASMVVEVDDGSASGAAYVRGWRGIMTPARDELKGLAYQLIAVRSWSAASVRWPEGTAHGGTHLVWHVQFRVPPGAVPELYDLRVEWVGEGGRRRDSQAHAVSVLPPEVAGPGLPRSFRFLTLADIHVHKRGISGFMQPQTDKGISEDGTPVYLERAIEQVNLIRPDFVVILGDCVRAQHKPGEYQVEFEKFFGELRRFQVPVFLVAGNHDQYINQVDGARVWEQNIGPLFYSFDLGGSHFSFVNSYQWPVEDRIIMLKMRLLAYPRKWQGQVLGARHEDDFSTFTGELAWLRSDLEAAQNADLRVIFCHHDPFAPAGKGASFDNEMIGGIFPLGGGGEGKDALQDLAARYRVNAFFTGHLHIDYVGRANWSNNVGETIYANQTCVYFDEGGLRRKYPGYRLVEVGDGKMSGYTYMDKFHSTPLYDGSALHGLTDIDGLDRAALAATRLPVAGGTAGWRVTNYLGEDAELRGLIRVAPSSPTGPVSGGEVYRTVKVPGRDGRVLVYVKATVPRGVPGKSGSRPGKPTRLDVLVPTG